MRKVLSEGKVRESDFLAVENSSFDLYRTLGHVLRDLIKQELELGIYPCLKNPDNKTSPCCPLTEQKFRFCVIPRAKVDAGKGERNLDIGRLENLFCVSGRFRGKSTRAGFEAPEKDSQQHAYRLCLGCFPSLYWDSVQSPADTKKLYDLYYKFAEDMRYCFALAWPSVKEQLFDGDYEGVVKTTLPVAEYCLEALKTNASKSLGINCSFV
jgi:hypothetical protein